MFRFLLVSITAVLLISSLAWQNDHVPSEDSAILGAHQAPPPAPAAAYPADLINDIPWSGGKTNVADIQAAFDNARNGENSQLGTSLPGINMPTQSVWDSMSDGEKALWLINQEREDRGVDPLQGLEDNVTNVAQ